MVIISVSRSKEKAMLSTVKMLRRLLRNAFFVTNRVNVISELQREQEAGHRRQARPSPPRIDEGVHYRQPDRISFFPGSKDDLHTRAPPGSILSRPGLAHKWRSSRGWGDKCHKKTPHNNYIRHRDGKVTLKFPGLGRRA